MKELVDLFFTFAKIGGLTFGGGYAMLPMIQNEIVENKKWASEEDVINYYAVGQCTPGIIAVNTATFIGYKTKGIIGGIVATLGVVFPSLIIIMLIAAFLSNFADLPIVQHAFSGVRVVVVALILDSIIKIGKTSIKNIITLIIAVGAFILGTVFNVSPIYIVIITAIIGLLMGRAGMKKWFMCNLCGNFLK